MPDRPMIDLEQVRQARALRASRKQRWLDSLSGPEEPVLQEQFWQGSERLYILFSGLYGLMSIPTEVFFRNSGLIDQSRLVLRDPHHAWYQRGLPGIGDDVHAIARYLQQRIEQSGAREVRFVGNCKGGFAALLFCALLRQGKAIAFVPQTFLSPERQDEDPRQPYLVEELYRHRTDRHIYDLRPWMLQHAPDTEAEVYVGDNPYDLNHAQELDGFRRIRVHQVGGGGHRVAAQLNKQGRLSQVLAA
ncbi:MAG: hypothetical protein Q8Q73_10125 [Stagnimonas sp.]|nr:hypothetical protein [Stagnimonas sp.]